MEATDVVSAVRPVGKTSACRTWGVRAVRAAAGLSVAVVIGGAGVAANGSIGQQASAGTSGQLAPCVAMDAAGPCYWDSAISIVNGAGGPMAPCATEDSAGPCYWDAAVMGNGQGQSFIAWANGTRSYPTK